ncbi:MAG: fructosamine kinase family protein [Gemmatimonadota bacterium]
MTLPPDLRTEIEAALAAGGVARRIRNDAPVGGGCISPAARIEAEGGARFFVKWSERGAPADFFTSQADGLRALDRAAAVRVPGVEAVGERWLLLEWLDPGSATRDTWTSLGRQLAALHRESAPAFGAATDNYIGSLAQSNGRCETWPAFWVDRRIGRQWEQARQRGFFDEADERAFRQLCAAIPDALAAGDADGPSLLHGDLWGGNVHVMADGAAALIDPSTYHGHREVDLAMAELFGGFPREFFVAYREAWPLEPGYDSARRDLYQLYYLLVHVNLFGSGYTGGVRRVLRPFGR